LLHIIRAALRKFIQLEDTPNSYSGLAGKLFKVNSAETALEASTNTDSEIAEAVNVAANVMEKVAEVEVSSDCDYVEFTGLDGNSAWFYILLATAKNATSSAYDLYLYVNGDTDNTHYYTQQLRANDTSISGTRINCPTVAVLGENEGCLFEVKITKDPNDYFRFFSNVSRFTGSSVEEMIRSGTKTSTITNITSLRIQAQNANAIAAGSKFILFKARRG